MPWGKRGSRCCCGDDCCEGCDNCTWTVVLSGMDDATCTACSNIDGTYVVSTSYACNESMGDTRIGTADGQCGGSGNCGCAFSDSFTITPSACTTTTTVWIAVILCCNSIRVALEIKGSRVTNDIHLWERSKSAGDYPNCNISNLDIPSLSQSGDFGGIQCQSRPLLGSNATITLTANC